MPESKLELIEARIREAEAQIDRQRQLLFELREAGKPTETAASLLDGFEGLLARYNVERNRLLAQIDGGEDT